MHCYADPSVPTLRRTGDRGVGTRTPQRIPQVSRFRWVFDSAIVRKRSRREAGINTLRNSCPFSRYASLH